MKQLLTKSFADIDQSDIDRLINNAEEESNGLEIKGPLPGVDVAKEPWQKGINEIKDRTRDKVLPEVVAMANAGGGVVILGINETKDVPHRAKGSYPLRDCHELAKRFEDMACSCIDPRLPSLEVKGIPLKPNGYGVVIFRTLTSPRAPHGLTTTRHAYVRRGSRTETMLVREIQEMTLQAQRGLNWIDERLAGRAAEFQEWWRNQEFPAARRTEEKILGGIRATVMPTAQVVAVDRPYANNDLWPQPTQRKGQIHQLPALFNLRAAMQTYGSGASDPPQPILRGGRRNFVVAQGVFLRQEIHWDGLCDLWLHKQFSSSESGFDPIDVIGLAAEALHLADGVRRAGGAPGIDMILEVELGSSPPDKITPPKLSGRWPPGNHHNSRKLPSESYILPRIPIISDNFYDALKFHLNDLLNAAGNETCEDFLIDLGQ